MARKLASPLVQSTHLLRAPEAPKARRTVYISVWQDDSTAVVDLEAIGIEPTDSQESIMRSIMARQTVPLKGTHHQHAVVAHIRKFEFSEYA